MADRFEWVVLDRDLTAPPGSPVEGDSYLVAASATGAWATFDRNRATWSEEDAAWAFDAPALEQKVAVLDEGITLVYKGSPNYWVQFPGALERLTAPRTYYVRAAGNDANDGLTTGTAVLTRNQAILLASRVDTNNFAITIDVIEVRTFTDSMQLRPLMGGGFGSIIGDTSGNTIANAVASAVIGYEVSGNARRFAGAWTINKFTLTSSGANAIDADASTQIVLGDDVKIGTSLIGILSQGGAIVKAPSGLKISASIARALAARGGRIEIDNTVTITGTPAWATAFAEARAAGAIVNGTSFAVSGASTGPRFSIFPGGTIETPADLPGNAEGTVLAGGRYYNSTTGEIRSPVRHNTAASDPGVGDDAADGYGLLSEWLNTATGIVFKCVDATVGAAIWAYKTTLRSYTLAGLPSAATNSLARIWCSDLGGGAGVLVSNGTVWMRLSRGLASVSSNADFTLTVLTDATLIRHTGALTAERKITLSATNVYNGAIFEISRTGTGAFPLTVQNPTPTTLTQLYPGQSAIFIYDGSAWRLLHKGTLEAFYKTFVEASADLPRNTTTVLANDTEVLFPMEANKKYRFAAELRYTAGTGAMKWGFTGPASPTYMNVDRSWIAPGGSAVAGVAVESAYNVTGLAIAGAGEGVIWIGGVIHNGANAGNFVLQWAQNASSAQNTTRRAASSLEYKQLA